MEKGKLRIIGLKCAMKSILGDSSWKNLNYKIRNDIIISIIWILIDKSNKFRMGEVYKIKTNVCQRRSLFPSSCCEVEASCLMIMSGYFLCICELLCRNSWISSWTFSTAISMNILCTAFHRILIAYWGSLWDFGLIGHLSVHQLIFDPLLLECWILLQMYLLKIHTFWWRFLVMGRSPLYSFEQFALRFAQFLSPLCFCRCENLVFCSYFHSKVRYDIVPGSLNMH